MKKLAFKYPMFHKGENLTVRNGDKWDGEIGPVEITNQYGAFVRTAEVVKTEVKNFADLEDDDLRMEHDPTCATVQGLKAMMREVYGYDFKVDNNVTLVTFIIE